MPCRRYCAATFCSNNNSNCELSFFSFPEERERFNTWAVASDRFDLLNKKIKSNKNYFLCAAHFAIEMFTSDLRNRLIKNAVPVPLDTTSEANGSPEIELEIEPKTEPETESETEPETVLRSATSPAQSQHEETETTENVHVHSTNTQTINVETRSIGTQTGNELTSSTPRKRKVVRLLLETERKKLKSLCTEDDIVQFNSLCDRLLPENLANFVKTQAQIYSKKK